MAIKSQKNQKIMVVMISILLAFFLWLYVMGEKNPILTKVIPNVQVSIMNSEEITKADLALVPNQKFRMDVNVTGRTFDISKISSADIKIEADMKESLKKGNNEIPINIITSQKGVVITGKNGSQHLNVKLDTLEQKNVPVKVDIRGNVKDGYGYTSPLIRPEMVKISGPSDYVDMVFSVVGEINVSGNSSNISRSILMTPQDKNGIPVAHINISPKYVEATVSIKPSKEVPIKVNTYGLIGTGKILKRIKPQVSSILIIGDYNYLNKINEINTTSLDLSKITNSATIQLALNLPIGVSVVGGINSVNVDLTLENKTEKVINLTIAENNSNTDYDYILSADTVSAVLDGPESIMKALNEKSVNAFIDVSGFTEGSYNVPITISPIDGVEIKTLTPDKVDVQITKK